MSTIKDSFKKILIPITIITAVLMLINVVFSYIEIGLVNLKVRGFLGFEYPKSMPNPAHFTFIDEIVRLVSLFIISPFIVGGFRYCLKKLDGAEYNIKEIFFFFSKPQYIIGAFIVNILPSATGNIVSTLFIFLLSIYQYSRSRFLLLMSIILCILFLVLNTFLWLSVFIYSARVNESASKAVSRSFSATKRSFIKIFVMILVCTILNSSYYVALLLFDMPISETDDFFRSVFDDAVQLVLAVFINFILIVLAYTILKKEQILEFDMFLNRSVSSVPEKTDTDPADDTPFIEPYDFCIEADERFHDEKVIETEDIRGVDILAVLEEMNLAFDIVNHFGIRRKLKKMFDDLAFEIGEFVSYEGGRSIENSFEEEIDERTFEVSAEITKASDSEPFSLTVTVSALTLEDE